MSRDPLHARQSVGAFAAVLRGEASRMSRPPSSSLPVRLTTPVAPVVVSRGPIPAERAHRPAAPGSAEKTYGWFHVGALGCYRQVLDEMIARIERSGILEATEKVFVCVAGPTQYQFPPWMTVLHRWYDYSRGESPTLQHMWDWSKTVRTGKVWYVHTKGASHPFDNPFVAAWRDYMMDYVIDRWRDCSEALEDHDLAGVEWVQGDEFGRVLDAPHMNGKRCFSGNFWWSRADWLANLPADRVSLGGGRWDAEFEFTSVGTPRVMEFHHEGVNLYETMYSRSTRERSAREFGLPAPRPSPDEEARIRLAMLVETCPFGSGPCGCGSGPPRLCSHPDHPAEVRKAECMTCKAAELAVSPMR